MTTYLTNGGALWLSAVLNATARPRLLYSHVLELFAANFVLLVLLVETIALYARRARTIECERAERESRLMRNGDITKPEPVLTLISQSGL